MRQYDEDISQPPCHKLGAHSRPIQNQNRKEKKRKVHERCSRVYQCLGKQIPGSARIQHAKVQQQSNKSEKQDEDRPFLNIYFWNVTLTLCAICSPIAHGGSIHGLFHVWLVVGIPGSRQHGSSTLCQASGKVALIERVGERSFLASTA